MTKRDEIKKIWQECFSDPREYVEMYFNRVYRDADGMVLNKDNHAVSSLLLQQYTMQFHGHDVPISYIAGAATRRNARGKGYMSELMVNALYASAERGDMLCTLIPAHDWLYYYYDRFGFSAVFLVDAQRFTAGHTFPITGQYKSREHFYEPDVIEAFQRLERMRPCTVLHSERDFLNIIDDLSMEPNGRMVVMAHPESGEITSMAWAVVRDDIVLVTELLGKNDDARTAALRELRKHYPDMPFKVLAPASENDDSHRKLYPHGMARLVNVKFCFDTIAAAHHDLDITIRVKDFLMPFNSHIYRISHGKCDINDTYTGRFDLDIDIEVLNKLIFSAPHIGIVTGLPSEHPHMALMLD